jgi:GNAT superfamily N-acetyltransferase
MLQSDSLSIRPAQSSDKSVVLAFCQHTWDDETDYIPSVWDVWFSDPAGHILIADFKGQPVGMTRLIRLSGTEGWWEGLRVDRAYRRQGIGSRLTAAALELAGCLGLTTLRTCVSVTNTPMHPFVQHQGFEPQGDFAVYSAPASHSSPTALQPLGPQDCDRVWAAINHFAPNECDRLFVARGAKWQALTPESLARPLEQGWVWGAPHGDTLTSLFMRSHMESPDGTLWIGWLGGAPEGLQLALEALPGLADQLGFKAIGGFLPQSDTLLPLLEAAGYSFSDTSVYRVYAKSLRAYPL